MDPCGAPCLRQLGLPGTGFELLVFKVGHITLKFVLIWFVKSSYVLVHKVHKVYKVTCVLRTEFIGSLAAVDKVPRRGPWTLWTLWTLRTLWTRAQLVYFTIPENPMNASASNPAVTNAIGVPFMPFGMDDSSSCSRIPAKMVNAKPKPIAVEAANTTDSSRL